MITVDAKPVVTTTTWLQCNWATTIPRLILRSYDTRRIAVV